VPILLPTPASWRTSLRLSARRARSIDLFIICCSTIVYIYIYRLLANRAQSMESADTEPSRSERSSIESATGVTHRPPASARKYSRPYWPSGTSVLIAALPLLLGAIKLQCLGARRVRHPRLILKMRSTTLQLLPHNSNIVQRSAPPRIIANVQLLHKTPQQGYFDHRALAARVPKSTE
jgi:hypothetical protein